ncbi:MAG: AsmA family protein [Candidatus Omnitrophica bacterium]|nr:AsmA family protein [Candidatus Omnitrophota bacterium]
MKKLFTAALVIFMLIIAGIFIFIITFDANKYKDLLAEKIEDAIGKDVRIDEVSLAFLPALSFRIGEISVKDNDKTWGDALLKASSVSAGIKILPLIKKDIQLQYLNIKEIVVNIPEEASPVRIPIFSDIDLRGEMKGNDIAIKRLTGIAAGGHFSVKGNINDIFNNQYLEMDLALKGMNIGEILPDAASGDPSLEAKLTMNAHVNAQGFDPLEALDTLSASGTARIDKGILKGVNVLSMALDKIDSILPDVAYRLKNKLPARYGDLLKQDYTAFRPIDMAFSMKDGKITFQETTISSDAFYMVGRGYFDVRANLGVKCDLFIPEDLSKEFVAQVYELKYLQDNKGRIMMPVDIVGRIPDVSVKPDKDYVTKKLIAATGEILIKSIFNKGSKPSSGDTSGADNSGEPNDNTQGEQDPQKEQSPEEVIIKSIFDIISGAGK